MDADPEEVRRQAHLEVEGLDESEEMEARLEDAREAASEIEVPEHDADLPADDEELAVGLEHSEDEGEAAAEAGQ